MLSLGLFLIYFTFMFKIHYESLYSLLIWKLQWIRELLNVIDCDYISIFATNHAVPDAVLKPRAWYSLSLSAYKQAKIFDALSMLDNGIQSLAHTICPSIKMWLDIDLLNILFKKTDNLNYFWGLITHRQLVICNSPIFF